MSFKVPEATSNIVPEGIYEVIMKDGGYMDATKGGTVYMNIPLVIRNDVNQKCKNMIVWDAIWTEASEKHINFKVGNISKAIELPAGTDFDDIEAWGAFLKGKVMKISVKHNEYNGQISAQAAGYYKTDYPDVKHVFKAKSVAVTPDINDFEEIPDDGDIPF